MTMKEYSTFPNALELELHYQMQFSVTSRTLVLYDQWMGPSRVPGINNNESTRTVASQSDAV